MLTILFFPSSVRQMQRLLVDGSAQRRLQSETEEVEVVPVLAVGHRGHQRSPG